MLVIFSDSSVLLEIAVSLRSSSASCFSVNGISNQQIEVISFVWCACHRHFPSYSTLSCFSVNGISNQQIEQLFLLFGVSATGILCLISCSNVIIIVILIDRPAVYYMLNVHVFTTIFPATIPSHV